MASLGQGLREAREARHVSIEEIASITKIVPRYLEALENDRLDIMPGGFFIKGIIREYARVVGLNGDEILARYKEAGLVGEPERKRSLFQKAATEPTPPLPPPYVPSAPVEPLEQARVLPAPEAASAPEKQEQKEEPAPAAAPELLFEPLPKRELSPAARKRIVSWIWRSLALVALISVLIVLWSNRRPHPPQATPGEIEAVLTDKTVPPLQKAEPAAAPSADLTAKTGATTQAPQTSQPSAPAQTQTAQEPAPKSEAPAPTAGEVWKGVTIEITFIAETWIHVRADGEIKIDGVFPAGTTAHARADQLLLVHTGNAGGFTFLLNGQPAKPLGRSGQVLTDIKITPENYKSFLAPQS
jgi:cytoskeleton protein RodZ